MKVKLIVEGKELEVEISKKEYKKLQTREEKETGYKRVLSYSDKPYYCIEGVGNVLALTDTEHETDNLLYETANYYSHKDVAENNARADKLMRQLRRFSVENRENEIDWNDENIEKYFIYYNFKEKTLSKGINTFVKDFGVPYFDSLIATQAAIDKFYHELIWYFTKYQDSL